MPRTYKIWRNGEIREVKSLSRFKPRFGVIVTMRLWGRVNCYSGRRAKPENQIFFRTYEDLMEFVATQRNPVVWRACKNCKPHKNDAYKKIVGAWTLIPGFDRD